MPSEFTKLRKNGNQSSRQAVDSSRAKINDEITGVLDDELTVLMRLPEHVLTNYCYTMLSNIWEIHDKKIKTLLLLIKTTNMKQDENYYFSDPFFVKGK